MKLLILNHYAGSDRLGMEYRPFYLAREWVRQGHQATIIAAGFHHLRQRQPDMGLRWGEVWEEGVRFRFIPTPPYAGNGAGRILNMAAYVGRLWLTAHRIAAEEQPDAVICSSTYPLDIWPGERIARAAGAMLVHEVHDLWPLTPRLLGGYSARHPFIRVMQAAEDHACRRADRIISLLPATKDYLVQHGMHPAKWAHIPNGVVLTGAPIPARPPTALPPPVADTIAAARTQGRFLLGYAGGINPSNPIETLVEAAHALRNERVSLFIAGGGPEREAVEASIHALGAENIHLIGMLDKAAVPGFLSAMDALVMPWRRSPLYRYGVSPNKIFDYMAAAKPIVVAVEAANDPVADAGCGITVPPEDPAAMADAIRRLMRLPPETRDRLGQAGRRFVERHHDYAVLASAFLQVLGEGKATRSAHAPSRLIRFGTG